VNNNYEAIVSVLWLGAKHSPRYYSHLIGFKTKLHDATSQKKTIFLFNLFVKFVTILYINLHVIFL
jgi:hypothetical protein